MRKDRAARARIYWPGVHHDVTAPRRVRPLSCPLESKSYIARATTRLPSALALSRSLSQDTVWMEMDAPQYEILVVPGVGAPHRDELRQECYDVRIDVFHREQKFPLDTEIDESVSYCTSGA